MNPQVFTAIQTLLLAFLVLEQPFLAQTFSVGLGGQFFKKREITVRSLNFQVFVSKLSYLLKELSLNSLCNFSRYSAFAPEFPPSYPLRKNTIYFLLLKAVLQERGRGQFFKKREVTGRYLNS